MAKQSSVNLDITNNADGFDISGGTTVRKLGITGGDVTIAGSGSATVTFPTTSTTIAGLGITQSFSALQSFSAGISASGGVTFANAISVDLIKIGRGSGGVTSNVAIGNGYDKPNLEFNTTGRDNTAIGYDVLPYNTTGNYNVGVGVSALENNDSGSNNTAVGAATLIIGNGSENTAVGAAALIYSTDNQNTAIGYRAGSIRGTGGSTRTSGTGGIFIGYQARASGNARTNEIVIGTNALGLGSNTAVIGATAQTAATIYGLMNLPGGLSASGATFSGDIAVNGGDITTTSATATLFNANATSLDILNTQSSGFTLNIGNATTYSGKKTINIGSNIGGGASSQITIGSASSASRVSILGGITLGDVVGSVVRVAYPSTFDVTATSTFTNSTFSGLLSANAGISASGATFSGDIAVNGGDITTTSATATLYNTTATTVNIGNAASTVNLMGATANTQTGIGSQCYVKTGQITTTTTSKQEIFRYPTVTLFTGDRYFADIIVTANYGSGSGGSVGSQITKMLVATSYNTAINHTEYGNVNTSGNLAVYTAEISGNDVIIYATPTNTTSTVFNTYATLIKGSYGLNTEE